MLGVAVVTGRSIPFLIPKTYSVNSKQGPTYSIHFPSIPFSHFLPSHIKDVSIHQYHPAFGLHGNPSYSPESYSLLGIFQVSFDILCDDGPPLPLSGPLGREISIQFSLSSE